MSQELLLDIEGEAARLTFNRPEVRNAVTYEMWEEIPRLMGKLADDDRIRVVVLTGAGNRAFVSGADISEFAEKRSDAEGVALYNETAEGAIRSLREFPKPLIAMIRGYCMGGGCNIALCCDLRFCSSDARFGIPAARLGLAYGFDGVRQLVHLAGPAFAKEILFMGRPFSAEEALLMGLVNRVLPAPALEPYVLDCCRTISENAPLTHRASKCAVDQACLDPEERVTQRIQELIDTCYHSEDYKEGRQAYLEKRPPRFQGR